MKITKKILSIILVIMMIIPMSVTAFAEGTPLYAGDNWTAYAAKYSKTTNKIIAPKTGGVAVVKTDGFGFADNEDGGIAVTTPNYQTFNGVYGTSMITSNNSCELDGLEVYITPDTFTNELDNVGSGNQFSVLWTEEKLTGVADPVNSTGLLDAISASSNGLRHCIPVVKGATEGKASTSSTATGSTNGKALCINVSNEYAAYEGENKFSSVSITYYDGYYINANDHHPGYRWSFTARNSSQTAKADKSGILTMYEEIDFSEGLKISVRADNTVGYIVSVNGVDYYKGDKVGYFPDAEVNTKDNGTRNSGLGNSLTSTLTDDDYVYKTDKLKSSLEYAKKDINLSGLKSVSKGYLTIGCVSNGNFKTPVDNEHFCNYTVATVNGKKTADWKGEATCKHLNCTAWQPVTPASCTQKGKEQCTCNDCKAVLTKSIAKLEHKYTEWQPVKEPSCIEKGQEKRSCTSCLKEFYQDIDMTAHSMTKTERVEATYSTKGNIEYYTCSKCKLLYKDAAGTKKVSAADTVLSKIPLPFTDVASNIWYYNSVAFCVDAKLFKGTSATTFSPNVKLTREQFMMVLFNFEGADEADYQGATGFTDVPSGQWYSAAVKWAKDEGITSGLGGGKFGLGVEISREQFATLLMNYANGKGKDTSARANIDAYTDKGQVSSWALDGIKWAVAEKLMSGTTATTLSPKSIADRATATMLFMNFSNYFEIDT